MNCKQPIENNYLIGASASELVNDKFSSLEGCFPSVSHKNQGIGHGGC